MEVAHWRLDSHKPIRMAKSATKQATSRFRFAELGSSTGIMGGGLGKKCHISIKMIH